jgi:hypothetical protein
MRADADFMVYVAARWPRLVRQAVLLGSPPDEAPEAATEALSRVRRDWGRATREDDVDRLVHAELAATVARRPRTPEAARQQAAEELLVLAPPTLDDVRHHERVRRRKVRRRAATYTVPLLLVGVGAGAYLATSGAPADEPEPVGPLRAAAITREENPVPDVVWFADGRLHLAHTVLAVEALRDMTVLGNGVVYGDDEGRVIYAADDGSRGLLGHKDPDVPVAASDGSGLAAWYDPDEEKVVVVEGATGNPVASIAVGDEPEVVAVDADVVYVVGDNGSRALLPTGRTGEAPVSPAGLLDVRSRVRAFQLDPRTIQVVQSAFTVEFDFAGVGADLSPDGGQVATMSPDDGSVLLYDARSGAELDGALEGGGELVAVTPRSRGVMAYVLREGDALELRTCQLWGDECRALDVVEVDSVPVLAR